MARFQRVGYNFCQLNNKHRSRRNAGQKDGDSDGEVSRALVRAGVPVFCLG